MKVEAIRTGYYNHRRVYKGEQFDLFKETDFSKAWMKTLDSKDVRPAPTPKVVKEVPILDEPSSEDVI